MNFIGIIPARYGSTRLPGKPLLKIGQKTMIQRVYEQVSQVLDDVLIATDDLRIENEAKNFNANVVMTSPKHKSGTDRIAEAIEIFTKKNGKKFDVIINIQGDEPFIKPEQIQLLMNCFANRETEIATLVKKIDKNNEIINPNTVKAIFDKHKNAMYFSRSAIPFIRGKEKLNWWKEHDFYKHIGIYAYKSNILNEITKLPISSLEKAESLEQNRWLENGYKIKVEVTFFESISIDTKEDLEKIL